MPALAGLADGVNLADLPVLAAPPPLLGSGVSAETAESIAMDVDEVIKALLPEYDDDDAVSPVSIRKAREQLTGMAKRMRRSYSVACPAPAAPR